MSKELEALNELKYQCVNYEANIERFDIIENALKDYEWLKPTKIIVANKEISDKDLDELKNKRMFVGSLKQCEVKPLFDEEHQLTKLKAFEIIKEKMVNVCAFISWNNVVDFDYQKYLKLEYTYLISGKRLTPEEFDLLKEVIKEYE